MTRDEVMSLPAGKEMDALILEHVFGARWFNRGGRNFLLSFNDVIGWDGNSGKIETIVPDYIGGFGYADDIVKAWEIVEKMRNGFAFSLNENEDTENWDAWFWGRGSNEDHWIATAETVPLAICRAALLAITESK